VATGAITFSGFGGGFDSSTVISKLVELERSPETDLNQRKSDTNAQISVLGNLAGVLANLKTRAQALDTVSDVHPVTAQSSDTTRVAISASAGTSPASYAISVQKLAQQQITSSTRFDSDTAGIAGAGTLDITVGGAAQPQVHVVYGANDSLSGIAKTINDANGGVSAAVVFDGGKYRLIVTGNNTGLANGFTFSPGTPLGLDATANLQDAWDAQLTINSLQNVTRPSNTISDLASGVTFTLLSQTPNGGAATQLTVAADKTGLETKIKNLVDAYNAVENLLDGQLSYDGTTKGTNTLFGDTSLELLQRSLRSMMSQEYTHGTGTIGAMALGLSLDKTGQLSFDATKFEAAVASDPTAAQDMLAGASGLAQKLSDLSDLYTKADTGVIAAKQDGMKRRIASYDQQITKTEDQANALEDTLRKQFAALDAIMADYKQQSSYLTQLFGTASSSSSSGSGG
jgi:flagellar hook-associated protein 2